MALALSVASGSGYQKLGLEVLIGNTPALEAYQAAGFRIVDELRDTALERELGSSGFNHMDRRV